MSLRLGASRGCKRGPEMMKKGIPAKDAKEHEEKWMLHRRVETWNSALDYRHVARYHPLSTW